MPSGRIIMGRQYFHLKNQRTSTGLQRCGILISCIVQELPCKEIWCNTERHHEAYYEMSSPTPTELLPVLSGIAPAPLCREHHTHTLVTKAGAELPRKEWVSLNRLRTGVCRFGVFMYRWGLRQSAACQCGAPEQTVQHLMDECPNFCPPVALNLCHPGPSTREWLRLLGDII